LKTLTHQIEVRAPIERVFDLARSVSLHVKSVEAVQEEIVGDVRRGLVRLGEELTWHGRYLGFMQTMKFRVAAWDPPSYLHNSMVEGLFLTLDHHYSFRTSGEVTVMSNELNYAMPYGFAGQVFDFLLMGPHLKRFLAERARFLKDVAEGDEWKKYLGPESPWSPPENGIPELNPMA